MATTRVANSMEIVTKQKRLETARGQLKTEFVGLNNIIDELIDIVSSWYIFPYIQEKPVIVNLWGLTGTGKTSLVNRLVELLGFSGKFFKFNMLERNSYSFDVGRVLENVYDDFSGQPLVISFDEFQNARSISEDGMEKDKTSMRIVWDIMDSGKFWKSREESITIHLNEYIKFCRYMITLGVKVKNGIVVEKKELFKEKLEILNERETFIFSSSYYLTDQEREKPNELYFANLNLASYLYKISKDIFVNSYEIVDKLSTMNGEETIAFLEMVLDHGTGMKMIDLSKSIIFVMGNIDEAYTMGDNYTTDISADEFYEESKKINIVDIKNALKTRFRNEQIARFGNTHLIYPAFSEEGYKAIIEIELAKIEAKLDKEFSVKINFDKTIKEFIYSEGVVPAQGVRPLLTTIQNTISSRLSKVMSEMLVKELSPNLIIFKYQSGFVTIEYYATGELIHTFRDKQVLNLEKLRKPKRDDKQAIVAVHESGHAILTVLLLKIVPEAVFSVTTSIGIDGMVYSKTKWEYLSKKEMLKRIAIYLGGYVAEKLIFGEENVTTGSELDIKMATVFVTRMLKYSGMGKVVAHFNVKDINSNTSIFDLDNKINTEAQEWLKKGIELAEKTLKENYTLLLNMSDWLSDHPIMKKEQMKEFIVKYACNIKEQDLIEDGEHLFYRSHLKRLVSKSNNIKVNSPASNPFSLNKGNSMAG